MLKKYRYIILLFAALFIISFFAAWRLKFLEIPVKLAIEKALGISVKIEKLKYLPFDNLVLEGVSLGENFSAESIEVSFNFYRLIKSPKKPLSAFNSITLNSPSLVVNQELLNKISSFNALAGESDEKDLEIHALDGVIVYEKNRIKLKNIDIYSKKNIDYSLTAIYKGIDISSKGSIFKSSETFKTDISLIAEAEDFSVKMISKGEKRNNKFISYINIPKFIYKSFDISESSGVVSYDYESNYLFSQIIKGDSVIWVKRIEGIFKAGSDMSSEIIHPNLKGRVKTLINTDKGFINGYVKTGNIQYRNVELGSLDSVIEESYGKITAIKGKIMPLKYEFNAQIEDMKNFSLHLRDKSKKERISLNGNLLNMDMSLDIKKLNIADLDILNKRFLVKKGYLSSRGKGNIKDFNLNISIDNLIVSGGKETDLSLSIKRTTESFKADAYSSDGRLKGSYSYYSKDSWSTWIKLDKYFYSNKSIFSEGLPFEGTFTGGIEYSSPNNSKIKLLAENLAYNSEVIGKAKLDFISNSNFVNIKNFSLYPSSGTMSITSFMELGNKKNECRANINFYNFLYKNIGLAGSLDVLGVIEGEDNNKVFYGRASSRKLKINGLPEEPLSFNIKASTESINVYNVLYNSYLKGSAYIHRSDGKLGGDIKMAGFPLEYLSNEFNGKLKADISVGGYIKGPVAAANISAEGVKYKNLTYICSGNAIYKDRQITLDRFTVSSGSFRAELSGEIWPKFNVNAAIREMAIDHITNITSSISGIKGSFSGTLDIYGSYKNLSFSTELEGKRVYLKDNRIDLLRFQADYANGEANVGYLFSKFKNSEFRVISGSKISLDKKTLNVNCDLRNVHLGPTDIFGKLNLNGSWDMDSDSNLSFKTDIKTENLWINQHNLEDTIISFKYEDKLLTFYPKPKEKLVISGFVGINENSSYEFKRTKIVWNNKNEFIVDGLIGSELFDFTVKGSYLAGSAISEVLDLPVLIEGDLDINLIGKGNLSNPSFEGSIDYSAGNIDDIEYDNLNLQFSASNDTLTIIKAKLVKSDEYSMVANGYIPFYLTEEKKESVKNNPMQLVFSIEEGGLSMLENITDIFKSAKGDVRSKVIVSGTLNDPKVNGTARITNGQISSKVYFNKMKDLNVSLEFKDNKLYVNEFSNTVGNGTSKLEGDITFKGFDITDYNLHWYSDSKKGIRISVPQLPIPSPLIKPDDIKFLSDLSSGEPRFSLYFKGKADNPTLSGWIELDNTHFSYPSLVKDRSKNDPLRDIWDILSWDLELRTGKGTWYDNELVSVNIKGNLHLTGHGAVPDVTGKVESIRGTLVFIGKEFQIKRAVFECIKDVYLLEGEAETLATFGAQGGDDTIRMVVKKSEIEKIEPIFISSINPGLSSEDALKRAIGYDPNMSTENKNYYLRKQVFRLFDSNLTTPLVKTLLRKIKFEGSIRVVENDPDTESSNTEASNVNVTELLTNKKYVVSSYLTDDVVLGYSFAVDEIEKSIDVRHELQLQYRWIKDIGIRFFYEVPNQNIFRQFDQGVMFERKWRFGWGDKKKDSKKDK